MDAVLQEIIKFKDDQNKAFVARLMPTVDPELIWGVKTPQLRQIATWVWKNGYADEFIATLPHKYFEENNVHAFILENIKDYDECIKKVNEFLPYIDNWATCDQLSPKCFKNRQCLIDNIKEWISSTHTYVIRFGIGMLMKHFLDKNFKAEYLDMVANISSDEYYIDMMIAWFFATALAKQYEAAFTCIKDKRLKTWTHNKAIQKAIESLRIPDQRKAELRALKIK